MLNLNNTIRQCLAPILQHALSPQDDTRHFTELGLDSLLGLRLIGKLSEKLGVEVDPEWLYDYPSIEQLAAMLASAHPSLGSHP